MDLETLVLYRGAHPSCEEGCCLLEAVSCYSGGPFTDSPGVTSPALASFGRRLNDFLPDDERQELKPAVPLLVGTAKDGKDLKRAYLAADWAVREVAAGALAYAGQYSEAFTLWRLKEVVDRPTALAAKAAVYAAYAANDAYAANAAAVYAANAAANAAATYATYAANAANAAYAAAVYAANAANDANDAYAAAKAAATYATYETRRAVIDFFFKLIAAD